MDKIRILLADDHPILREGLRAVLETQPDFEVIAEAVNGIEAMQAVTNRPRELVIRTHQDKAHQILVTVKDCGVGIAAENADRLFNPFFTTKSGGMGMGLSICRSIVEAHGGRLSASANDGPGATFQFNLPLHLEDNTP